MLIEDFRMLDFLGVCGSVVYDITPPKTPLHLNPLEFYHIALDLLITIKYQQHRKCQSTQLSAVKLHTRFSVARPSHYMCDGLAQLINKNVGNKDSVASYHISSPSQD